MTEKGLELDKFTDFKAISDFADWVYVENVRAQKFLTDNMREGDIVVTHMLPTHMATPEKFRGSLTTVGSFATWRASSRSVNRLCGSSGTLTLRRIS